MADTDMAKQVGISASTVRRWRELPDFRARIAWDWSVDPRREEAALALADGYESDKAIAKRLNLGETTLQRWKHVPEFATRIREHAAMLRDRAVTEGLALKRERIRRYCRRLQEIEDVRRARSEDPDLQGIPGADQGWTVRTFRSVGGTVVPEYTEDTSLRREERDLLRQLAQEMGEWTERRDFVGTVEVSGALDFTAQMRRALEQADALADTSLAGTGLALPMGGLGGEDQPDAGDATED